MKVITALLVCLLVFSVQSKRTFLDFKAIIEHVNSLKTTWTAGHNEKFDGMDLETIKGMMGALEEPEHMKLPVKDIEPLEDIPESFESKEKWPSCPSISHIWDQSTCGSCWAFGAANAFTDRLCIARVEKGLNPEESPMISPEDLLTCCGFSCGNGCNGGYPSGAWNHIHNKGLSTGFEHGDTKYCKAYSFAKCDHHVDGPYGKCGSSKPTPKCVTSCPSNSSRTYSSDKHQAKSAYSVPSNVAKIQTEIMTHGPIEVAFTVYNDFLAYKSGVYHHTSGGALGGHAVRMVGWGVENGTPYWTVANSWNEGWGNNGYFRIRRGNNECGIEGQGVAGAANA